MAVPFHTHTFELPMATKDDVKQGTSTDRVVTPASLGDMAAGDSHDFATVDQGKKADTAMQPATYDPHATNKDVFAMDNMREGNDTKIMTQAERDKLGSLPTDAVSWNDLGALASKNKAAVGDLDTSNAATTDTYLRGDGSWAKPEGGGGGGDYLPLAGGTMTGKIVLDGDPVTELQAATKQYVDTHTGSGSGVPVNRKINTEKGLTGGGDLSADRTIALDDNSSKTINGAAMQDGSRNFSVATGNQSLKVNFNPPIDYVEGTSIWIKTDSINKDGATISNGDKGEMLIVKFNGAGAYEPLTGGEFAVDGIYNLVCQNASGIKQWILAPQGTSSASGGGSGIGGVSMHSTPGDYTWTVPDGVTKVRIRAQGAGGGGGATSDTFFSDLDGGDGGDTIVELSETVFKMTCSGGSGGPAGGVNHEGGAGGIATVTNGSQGHILMDNIASQSGDVEYIYQLVSAKQYFRAGKGGDSLGPLGFGTTGALYHVSSNVMVPARNGIYGGGGGGGGKSAEAGAQGAGGGAGGYGEVILTVNSGETINMTVGEGGAPGDPRFGGKGGGGYVMLEW